MQKICNSGRSAPIQIMSSQFLRENGSERSVKSFDEGRQTHLSLSLIQQAGHRRLVKQDLPFLKPCCLSLIPWLCCACYMMALKIVCSIAFPGIEVRLESL